MSSNAEAKKIKRFQDFIFKSFEDAMLGEEVESKLKRCIESHLTQEGTFSQVIQELSEDSDVWDHIKDQVRQFKGIEATRLQDNESDDSGSHAGRHVEDLTGSNDDVAIEVPEKKDELKPTRLLKTNSFIRTTGEHKHAADRQRGLFNLTQTIGIDSPSQTLQQEDANLNQTSENPPRKDTNSYILNRASLANFFHQKLGVEGRMDELVRELESGLLMYMSELIDGITAISEKPRNFENSYTLVGDKKNMHPNLDFVQTYDVANTIQLSHRRDSQINLFYDNKFKTTRDREDAAAKERAAAQALVNPLPEKVKTKEYNEEAEIMAVLSKIKQQKTKDNEKEDKINDNPNAVVNVILEQYTIGVPREAEVRLGKRPEPEPKVSLSGLHTPRQNFGEPQAPDFLLAK